MKNGTNLPVPDDEQFQLLEIGQPVKHRYSGEIGVIIHVSHWVIQGIREEKGYDPTKKENVYEVAWGFGKRAWASIFEVEPEDKEQMAWLEEVIEPYVKNNPFKVERIANAIRERLK
jgi:hypothetical protein